MQIETLKVFCDLVESRSFSQAAVRNFITQSAVSQQIRGLEARFETPLFVREGRAISLTPAGRILYDGARLILERLSQARLEMKSVGEQMAGSLRVATIYSVGIYEMSEVIKAFLKTYPKVNLHIEFSRANRVYEDCLAGNVDFGIVPYPKTRRGLEVVALPSDRLILICSPDHAFARHRRVDIKQLEGQDFIAFEKDIPSRIAIDDIFKEHGVRARVVMEFDNIETIKRSVEIGAGISVVPQLSVRREVQSGTLAELRFARRNFLRPLGIIVRHRHALSPAAGKFIHMLQHPQSERPAGAPRRK
jgi:LysR family transcriptional regulator, transcriptional activator of the cysJI operon